MRIVIDTREKTPWAFASETKSAKLDCGDYSVEGAENNIAIERKASVAEVAGNITKKHFWNAMERLSQVDRPYLILEFTKSDVAMYPKGPKGLPPNRQRFNKISPKFIFSSLNKISEMGIEVIYCEDSGSANSFAEQILSGV